MEIQFSEEFRKDYKRIKDKKIREKILKAIKKLNKMPEFGKPLSNKWSGYRRIIIKPFRIIYKIENGKIYINLFEHRKKVYK